MLPISSKEALDILKIENSSELMDVFRRASLARENTFGLKIEACSIINAKCGNCPQNCAFCAQSSSASVQTQTWPLLPPETIVQEAEKAQKAGVSRIGIVTSGTAVSSSAEKQSVLTSVREIRKKLKILPCASLGIVKKDFLLALKDAGLSRYHHNLEAAESFFPKICSSRPFSSQIKTVELAFEAGLSVCSGGIFGLGESLEQRIELIDTVRKLGADSIPINFLTPIPGTRLGNSELLKPLDCLKIIASARLMSPDKSVRLCGGREKILRDMQSMIFFAGADSLMTGGYLTTPGRTPAQDAKMIQDAGLETFLTAL